MMKNAVAAIKPKCTTNGKTSAEKYPDASGELDFSAALLVTVTSFFLLGFLCLTSLFPTQENREDDPSECSALKLLDHITKKMIPSFDEVITSGSSTSFRE